MACLSCGKVDYSAIKRHDGHHKPVKQQSAAACKFVNKFVNLHSNLFSERHLYLIWALSNENYL